MIISGALAFVYFVIVSRVQQAFFSFCPGYMAIWLNLNLKSGAKSKALLWRLQFCTWSRAERQLQFEDNFCLVSVSHLHKNQSIEMQCLLAWIYGRVEKKAAPRWAPHEGKINRKMSTQWPHIFWGLHFLSLGFYMQISSKWPTSCAVRAAGKCNFGEADSEKLREIGESPKSFVTRTTVKGPWRGLLGSKTQGTQGLFPGKAAKSIYADTRCKVFRWPGFKWPGYDWVLKW